ncbi:unnamed protein product [Musa banksii]
MKLPCFPYVTLWALILVAFFLSPASGTRLPKEANFCDRVVSSSSSAHRLPSRCIQSPPLPPAVGEEIDPRYGVEKWLVPAGPNPLHH